MEHYNYTVGRFRAYVPSKGNHPVSRPENSSAAPFSGAHHTVARPRRAGALRGLLSLLRGLSSRLHSPPGHRNEHGRRYPLFFRINFSRCILCGFCEEACPTYAIQLTNDLEFCEYDRKNLVYEKEDLLISCPEKHPDYNFYRVAGVSVGVKEKGESNN